MTQEAKMMSKDNQAIPTYICVKHVAKIVGVDKSTIWRWNRTGSIDFPKPSVSTGGTTRWDAGEVIAWCERSRGS